MSAVSGCNSRSGAADRSCQAVPAPQTRSPFTDLVSSSFPELSTSMASPGLACKATLSFLTWPQVLL